MHVCLYYFAPVLILPFPPKDVVSQTDQMRRNRKRGKSRAAVTSEDDDEDAVGGLRGLSKSSQEKIEVSVEGRKYLPFIIF